MFKMTPLMLSAKIGSLESTKLLLKLGANPDFETKGNGLTAIQIASVEEHTEVVWHIFLSLILSTFSYDFLFCSDPIGAPARSL